ncbi:MAG: CoA-acylating methylmalonate-semialdehyde dehydrogenase [Actinomycetota bacterium]
MNTNVVTHWMDNSSFSGTSDRYGDVTNPASGRTSSRVLLATEGDAERVIHSAVQAAETWSRTSLSARTRILFEFRQRLDERKQELAEIITAEHGKVLEDALGEVSRGQDVVEFACGIPHLLKGGFSEAVSTGINVHSKRQPLGVVGIICPFNFPAMVPMWFFPIAIATGNTVVIKPSEKTPSALLWIAELWKEVGLPDGVFNVLQGDKVAVDALLDSPDIRSISFVGSTPIARYVYQRATHNGKRVQALGGAKNHMVVLPDADLEQAADAAVNAGFGSAGERCMAVSVLVTVGPIADDVISRIVERVGKLRVGDGMLGCDMGPLVTTEHRDRVASFIDAGVDAGAELVVDGREIAVDGTEEGYWLGPTVFDRVEPHMSIYTEEIFGPVLSIVRVDTYEEAVELVNANPYGNGVAIFTRDGGAARRFELDVEVGMIGVNVPIPVPMAYYSFGGWKSSLFGDTHAHGTEGVHFFTRGKVVTSRWPDPAVAPPRELELAFPVQD